MAATAASKSSLPFTESIEDRIRTHSLVKGVRVSDFFLDFDHLRSGYVTREQFKRVLDQFVGIKLPSDDVEYLCTKYDFRKNGTVNYRQFMENVTKAFNPRDLRKEPSSQIVPAPEYLGTLRSFRPLTVTETGRLNAILIKLREHLGVHGLNIRDSFADMDRHNIGIVTESQFYRCIPLPPGITEDDVDILLRHYADPQRPGLFNYLNLHRDIIASNGGQSKSQSSPPTHKAMAMVPQHPVEPSIQAILDKVRVAVYKNGIRMVDFFKDYDHLRSGLITENQFRNACYLAVGGEASLTDLEIQKLAEYYRVDDQRVSYRELCDVSANAFNVPFLEKKPLETPYRPPQGYLGRAPCGLSPDEDVRVGELLMGIAEQIQQRRIMVKPFFQDFDRSTAYTRNVTPLQFSRAVTMLGFNITPNDCDLLCRKFADPISGDVNYPEFIQAVDPGYIASTIDGREEIPQLRERSLEAAVDTSSVNLMDVMSRIRHHVLTKRLRVCQIFEDFDPLRRGKVTKGQFKRCLDILGVGNLGGLPVGNAAMEALVKHYADVQKPDIDCDWKRFENDVESVFTLKGLEKNPGQRVAPPETFLMPTAGTLNWDNASEDLVYLFDPAMEKMRERIRQRRLDTVKQPFQDFDKLKTGHITRSQFHQCLTYFDFPLTHRETDSIQAKFADDQGINWARFIEELIPAEKIEWMYPKLAEESRRANQRTLREETDIATSLDGVLNKIKTKVFRERMRLKDFMRDYDKLHTGRLKKTQFRRALDVAKISLREAEVAMLEDAYTSPHDFNYMEYVKFCEEIESIFTQNHLEKNPLVDPEQFRVIPEAAQNELSHDEQQLASSGLQRIAEKVRQRRMQLHPKFEDFDPVHFGFVSRSQFRRALTAMELNDLASENEFEAISKMFYTNVGGRNDVNYNAFIDAVYTLANFELRKP